MAISENITDVQPIVSRYSGESRDIESALSKHQSSDHVNVYSCPNDGVSDKQAWSNERHSDECLSHKFHRGSFSSLQGSSQKENETPAKEKICRLVEAIEMGRQICYRFDDESGQYDVFALRTPDDEERESGDEVEQTHLIKPANSEQHVLILLQGSSQKENEPSCNEKVRRPSRAIEMGRQISYYFNDESGERDIFARRTPGDVETGSSSKVDQRHPSADSEQHVVRS